MSDKDKETFDKDDGDSETLSIEEWASRHQSEAVRFILITRYRDELL